jgi:hypothetical protein
MQLMTRLADSMLAICVLAVAFPARTLYDALGFDQTVFLNIAILVFVAWVVGYQMAQRRAIPN